VRSPNTDCIRVIPDVGKHKLKIWPWLRKVLVVVVGFPLLLLGLVMIPLPGPGLLICVGGLFVLALEFEWARRHLAYTRDKLSGVIERVSDRGGRLGSNLRDRWNHWRSGRRSA
jgi:uncharacterized protein (TIGR02611 family)